MDVKSIGILKPSQDEQDKQCSQCRDIVHEWGGQKITEYNHLGDVFLFFNLATLLVVLGLNQCDYVLVTQVLIIGTVIYFLRNFVSCLTICQANVNISRRPWMSGDCYWYILSGHTIIVLLFTYIIIHAQTNTMLKMCGITFCFLTMLFQIISREHYTVDIVLTAIIVHLALKAYVKN
jgi:hypothetical protein